MLTTNKKLYVILWSNYGNKITKLSIPLPRPSASPESRSSEHTINSLSYWAPAATGSTCIRSSKHTLKNLQDEPSVHTDCSNISRGMTICRHKATSSLGLICKERNIELVEPPALNIVNQCNTVSMADTGSKRENYNWISKYGFWWLCMLNI